MLVKSYSAPDRDDVDTRRWGCRVSPLQAAPTTREGGAAQTAFLKAGKEMVSAK